MLGNKNNNKKKNPQKKWHFMSVFILLYYLDEQPHCLQQPYKLSGCYFHIFPLYFSPFHWISQNGFFITKSFWE